MILCCRIPEMPVAALLLDREGDLSLAHRPLVIGGLPAERRPVRAVSPEARAFGIVPGMPLRQAEQLCPQARFFPVDPESEARLGRHLLAGLYALAPRVELDPEAGEAYVDLDGMGPLGADLLPAGFVVPSAAAGAPPPGADPAALAAFAQRVGDYLARRLRTRPWLGIGSNKFVAHVAAESGRDGLVGLVPRGGERAFLAGLPLAGTLPIAPALVDRFRLFGLRVLADLARMPADAVEAQFGAEARLALTLARGEDGRPLDPWAPPRRLEESSRLDPAVDNLEPLLFLVRGLLDRLGARLEAGGHAATSVRLRLELEDPGPGEPAAVDVLHHLRAPASGAEDLWIPVSALIRRQRLRRAVSRVALRVSGFCPAGSRQMDLLARRDNRLEDIARQLAVITEDLGPGVVRIAEVAGFPSLLDERRHRWLDPAPAPSRKPPPRRGQRPP